VQSKGVAEAHPVLVASRDVAAVVPVINPEIAPVEIAVEPISIGEP
jgi:hypothetical protein